MRQVAMVTGDVIECHNYYRLARECLLLSYELRLLKLFLDQDSVCVLCEV